ncbi:MAG: EAL domain-containing protein [Nitrospirota bacterium]|nr:EAL domain-containing protein [Nitrospirota bacterium]
MASEASKAISTHQASTGVGRVPVTKSVGKNGFRRKESPSGNPPGGPPPRNPGAVRVLVVDDDRAMRELATRSLEITGFSVAAAGNGRQGADLFAQFAPDIVLLDVMMPGLDGFGTCRAIRSMPGGANTPVIMITALDDLASIDRAYEAGATDFTTKPIQWPVLAQRLRYMARQKHISDKLRQSEERLVKAQRIARLGVWEWEIGPDRLTMSDAVLPLLGIAPQRFDGSFVSFVSLLHPEDSDRVLEHMQMGIAKRSSFFLEYRLQGTNPGEQTRFVHQEAEPEFDERGHLVRLVGTLQDITTQRETESRIHFLTRYDSLTSLPNRQLLTERLSDVLHDAQRRRQLAAVLNIGLDRFERINNAFGHQTGDSVLREVANRLRSSLERMVARSHHDLQPTIGRLGGDEFCIILSRVGDAAEVATAARQALEDLSAPFLVDGHEVYLTSSIGAVLYPADGTTVDGLLRNASAALRGAKVQGKNNYRFYTSTMNSDAMRRVALEGKLQKALENRELVLYYQPKVDIASGRLLGAEALVRWRHPELGMVAPGEFIPLAEESGLIVPIGEWVIAEACRQGVEWQKQGLPPINLAVNLSARQFWQEDLAERIGGILKESGFDPRHLEMEITESTFMHSATDTVLTLNSLKQMNISLSVDDFGTGYSSLAYLQRFPIDSLKVDRSFITDVTTNKDSATITRTVISMAQSLGLKVVAEGVETVEQLDFLQAEGCHLIQGFLVSPPVAPEDFRALLARGDQSLFPDRPDRPDRPGG